jgi:multidrug resistance efflux pump
MHGGHLRPTAVLFGVVALAACGGGTNAALEQAADMAEVVRGTLEVTVRESGEIRPHQLTEVKSEVEGRASLIFLIEEGTRVEAGDKLAELDASSLVDRRQNQEISVSKAQAALIQAEKNVEILVKELDAARKAAESAVTIAQMEVEKFLGRTSSRATQGGNAGTNAELVARLDDLIEEAITTEQQKHLSDGRGVVMDEEDEGEPVVLSETEPGAIATPAESVKDPAAIAAAGGTQDEEALALDEATKVPAPEVESDVSVGGVQRLTSMRRLVQKTEDLLTQPGETLRDALGRDMGDLSNRILQQIDAIRLAMADLELKADTYGHSRRLAAKSFITRNEMERDRLAYESQLSKVSLAWNDLDLLINYTLLREKIQLTQDLVNAQLELERVIASNEAREVRERSDLDTKRREYELTAEQLENLNQQIEKAVIVAPTPGIVVYAQDGDRRSSEPITEGTEIRERQTILELPDTSRMTAELKVQEAFIDLVRKGQAAVVRVDAYPDRPFAARVTRVAPLPDSGSRWSNNDRKVYKTWVELLDDDAGEVLRPNMSCEVEILIERKPDVLIVPKKAINREVRALYCWVHRDSGPVARQVQVGSESLAAVEITEGLEAGDWVYLNPPAGVQDPTDLVQPKPETEVKPVLGSDEPAPVRLDPELASKPFTEAESKDATERLTAWIREKFPEKVTDAEGDSRGMFRLFRDETVQAAIEQDPEMAMLSARLRATMMQRFGGGRGRGGRGPGGGPGSGGPGSGSGGGEDRAGN